MLASVVVHGHKAAATCIVKTDKESLSVIQRSALRPAERIAETQLMSIDQLG